jgi:hypothetical protein
LRQVTLPLPDLRGPQQINPEEGTVSTDTLKLDLPVQPSVTLLGQDGNAFNVMGLCRNALHAEMSKQGYSKSDIKDAVDKLLAAMMSSDYDHLLAVAMVNFDVS